MAIRRTPFINGKFYHIYNRGVDKRNIFEDYEDLERFFESMREFNTVEPIGSLFEKSFNDPIAKNKKNKPLVNFIAFCLNKNHYHFILEQVIDNGISEFMKRLGGYTWYFNNKHGRSGSLFQGTFKSIHIDSNEYLLHLSVYVNLNNKIHKLGGLTAKSSWEEYTSEYNDSFCKKDIILGQFKDSSEYKQFAESSLESIRERKEMEKFLLE
ncbi:transposase [Patescibacteria group bacterium]|nr:transposase [Patescibacteria group bacterium]